MLNVMLFLHIVGTAGVGIYAVLPFMAGKFSKLSGAEQGGLASGLVTAGRIGQYSLVVQLLTGGYLISQTGADYAVSWMITAIVLFLAIAALTGIVQASIKRVAAASKNGQDASAAIGKIRTLSYVVLIVFLIILWIMTNPWFS